MFGQELLQRSAQVSFIPVDGCAVKGPITSSQRRVHSPVDIFSTTQLICPQTQQGHLHPCTEEDRRRRGGGGGHLFCEALPLLGSLFGLSVLQNTFKKVGESYRGMNTRFFSKVKNISGAFLSQLMNVSSCMYKLRRPTNIVYIVYVNQITVTSGYQQQYTLGKLNVSSSLDCGHPRSPLQHWRNMLIKGHV